MRPHHQRDTEHGYQYEPVGRFPVFGAMYDPDERQQIETAARDYLEWLGAKEAIEYLIQQAEIAEAIGDSASGRDWRNIAEAAETQLRRRS